MTTVLTPSIPARSAAAMESVRITAVFARITMLAATAKSSTSTSELHLLLSVAASKGDPAQKGDYPFISDSLYQLIEVLAREKLDSLIWE